MSRITTTFPIAFIGLLVLALAAGCSRGNDRAEAQVIDEQPELDVPDMIATARTQEVYGPDGQARTLEELPFEMSWDLKFRAPVHTSWLSPNIPELIFFQLKNGEIHALDHKSGETKWITRQVPRLMEHPAYAHRVVVPGDNGAPNQNDDRLYVLSDDILFCFDAVYGQLIWRHHLGRSGPKGFLPSSGPSVAGGLASTRVFIGDWEGRIQVIGYGKSNPDDVNELPVPYHRWHWNLYSVPTATPVSVDDLTYVGDHDGKLHCFGIEREKRWSFDTVGQIVGSPMIRGNSLYIGSRANVVHVLNRLSGVEVAKIFMNKPISRQPFSYNGEGDRIYVWSGVGSDTSLSQVITRPVEVAIDDQPEDREVFPLEVERIDPSWSVDNVHRTIGSTPHHLFVTRASRPDRVLALNRKTGGIDWHWDINGDRAGGDFRFGRGGRVSQITQYVDPTDSVRSIFTVDRDGYVVAYRLFGQF